jgi:glycine/D-amino acid oxidase-like deaminating enzyme
MYVATNPDGVVVGAGILGLASAYHILQADSSLNLLVLDRLPGPGRGTTARSAAAYWDMFATPVNRQTRPAAPRLSLAPHRGPDGQLRPHPEGHGRRRGPV